MVVLFAAGNQLCMAELPVNDLQVTQRKSSRRHQRPMVLEDTASKETSLDRKSDSKGSFERSDQSVNPLVRRAAIAVGLSLTLAAVLLAITVLKQRTLGQPGDGEDLQILSTISLAPRCCLTLVKAQEQTILVARDSSGVKSMIVVPNHFSSFLDLEDPSPSLSLHGVAQPR